MKRHDLDPLSLVFGVMFLFAAASYLLSHATSVHPRWVPALPAALIAFGIGVLALVARRIQNEQSIQSEPRVAGPTEPGDPQTSLSE